MRTLYHEFESLEHLLSTRLLPGGGRHPVRLVVFGGTGAVGGASVMELCRLILLSKTCRPRPLSGEIYATGLSDKEITKFVSRLYLALGDQVDIEKIEPRRHYRVDGRIDLHFSLLQLEIPQDLPDTVNRRREEEGDSFDLEVVLKDYFANQQCPFLGFVQDLDSELLHSVAVAIPLPSVATYTLVAIDRLTAEHGLDHLARQRVKKHYLETFVRGLAVIQQRYARHVVIAHTTAVGGMYRVDGGQAEIRLGFAHSALGKRLVDKKYFADELTQLYIDQGFDVLVTAAAIGIDAVEFRCHLPADRGIRGTLQSRLADLDHNPVRPADLDSESILLYPFHRLPLSPDESAADSETLEFGGGRDLIVDAAIRSGENGLFSVANCVALYNVMKVAIPEELAMVLVRHALFGPERRRDWFQDKICYYGETENSYFALRLLDNYPQLMRAHHGPFNLQAFQALGSATHQARLHELGLVMLLLRLRELSQKFEHYEEQVLLDGLTDPDEFLWRETRIPSFEDLETFDHKRLALLLAELCETHSMESAGRLLGFDPRQQGRRLPGREKFLARLATQIGRYLQGITSLGIPILYTDPAGSGDRMLVGPYVAPLDMAIAHRQDLHHAWRRAAEEAGTSYETLRDWTIANNGFIDLRAHGLTSQAKEPGKDLADQVRRFQTPEELGEWLSQQRSGSYFTTVGLVALKLRLDRLHHQVKNRRVQLGTRETWKHLFLQDQDGRHLLSPGLVETTRMYCEGLGKVTGTELLWPSWGY